MALSSIRTACWAWAVTAGADVAAQYLARRRVDANRTLRISSFGMLTFGPQQSYLKALSRAFPEKTCANVFYKTMANQFVFAPVNISMAFLWDLWLTKELHKTRDKFQDLGPTLLKGGAFWIPMTWIGFSIVPVNTQAVFFKLAGVPWKIYTSHAVATRR